MIAVDDVRQKQLDYIGITEEDLRYLNKLKKHFAEIVDLVVDELYEYIRDQPELQQIIDEHSTIDRLKQTQRWYYMSLVEGEIDQSFIDRRLYIGRLHSKIGLTTEWYLGTYMLYLDISVNHFQRLLPDEWTKITLVLSRMFNFDSQLVLEAYSMDEKNKIQEMSNARQDALNRVSKVVQDLAAMMVELNGSSQSVADTATHTAELQDQANQKMSALRARVEEIEDVGTILQEVSDQTHLLGLNAAIEAAHAGEHGRGFGVVANEIRKLAAHSKNSLETINAKLSEILTVLNEVTSDSEETSRLAREQAASSQELTSFVQMIEEVTSELEHIGE